MYAGPAAGLTPNVAPGAQELNGLPMSKKCDMSGAVNSVYINTRKCLENRAAEDCVSTKNGYSSPVDYAIVLAIRGTLPNPNVNYFYGELRATWWIRFHGRIAYP